MKKLVLSIVILALITTSLHFYLKYTGYKYSVFLEYQAIPHVDLKNTLHESEDGLSGEIVGFVKFNNIKDQPKNARQYYILKPYKYSDENQSQYFSLEEVLKLYGMPPVSIGTSFLFPSDKTSKVGPFEDQAGNQFSLNTARDEFYMKDSTGDEITLITSNSDYKMFMREWLLSETP